MKELQGTLRADRVNTREPKVPVAAPRPSRKLTAAERREYSKLLRRVQVLRVATAGDDLALELAASAAAEFWRLRAMIAEKGETYETTTPAGSVMIRQRPEVALAADAWRRYAAMLQRFGLDPVSRARVETIQAADPDSKWNGLLGDPLDQFMQRRRRIPPAPGKDPARFFSA